VAIRFGKYFQILRVLHILLISVVENGFKRVNAKQQLNGGVDVA